MSLPNIRQTNLVIFLICAGLLAIALYMEFVEGFEPCPLCMAQRVAFSGIGLIALLAAIHNPVAVGRKVYGILLITFSILGVALAGRQVWLQSLPEHLIPACGPGIYYMLDVFPLAETIKTMLMGSGDCAEVVWRDPVIGLSIPGWTLVWFSFMTLVSLFQTIRKS